MNKKQLSQDHILLPFLCFKIFVLQGINGPIFVHEKNKIENLCFFPPFLIAILKIDQNIKNSENRALVPQYTHKFLLGSLLKLTFCEITIYFYSFTSKNNVTYHYY